MRKAFLTIGVFVAASLAGTVNAQQLTVGPVVGYSPVEAAGTPAGAAARGAADIIRAQGVYNEMTADSLLKFEQARSKYIENQRAWLELVGSRRRMILAQHDRDREDARARNSRYREEKIGQANLPPRLSSGDLNLETGEINWPYAMRRDTFAIDRADIEKLLAARAEEGAAPDLTETLYARTMDLKTDLQGHIRDVRTQDYIQARKFVDSLLLESQFPTDPPAVARKSKRLDTRTVSLDRSTDD